MITPYYDDGDVTLYLGDCRTFDDWRVPGAVLITDPPYGIDYRPGAKHLGSIAHAGVNGDDVAFDPRHLLTFDRAVIFGANNFASLLPDSGMWIVWDKVTRNGFDEHRLSECELAWTRGLGRRTRCYRHMWVGAFRESERGAHDHPTQKPLALMRFVVNVATKEHDVVADPYAGAGSTLIAAKYLGRKAVGVELDERFCETAAKRLSQGVLSLEW